MTDDPDPNLYPDGPTPEERLRDMESKLYQMESDQQTFRQQLTIAILVIMAALFYLVFRIS